MLIGFASGSSLAKAKEVEVLLENNKILPEPQCQHLSLNTRLEMVRVNDQGQAFIDLQVSCAICNEPYLFTLSMPPSPALRLAVAPEKVVKAARNRIVVPSLVAKNGS